MSKDNISQAAAAVRGIERQFKREHDVWIKHQMNDPKFVAVITEDHMESGVQWGVSLGGPNPDPIEYSPCASYDIARKLQLRLSKLRCPYCKSKAIWQPSEKHHTFTCEPCGTDFQVPGWKYPEE